MRASMKFVNEIILNECDFYVNNTEVILSAYPAMFLYVQSHGLGKLYGLPGTYMNLHV
jgi:hypothetical protein